MSAGLKRTRRRRSPEEIAAESVFRAAVLEYRCLLAQTRRGHRCDGPVDAHHLIEAQWLKAHFSTMDRKWDLVYAPEIGVPLCRWGRPTNHVAITSHADYIFFDEVPQRCLDWTEAHGIRYRLERECPQRREAS